MQIAIKETQKKKKTNAHLDQKTYHIKHYFKCGQNFPTVYLSCFFRILWNPVKFMFTYFSSLAKRGRRVGKDIRFMAFLTNFIIPMKRMISGTFSGLIKCHRIVRSTQRQIETRKRAYFKKSSPHFSIFVRSTSISAALSAL